MAYHRFALLDQSGRDLSNAKNKLPGKISRRVSSIDFFSATAPRLLLLPHDAIEGDE
jgi:hypothetical protein